MYPINSLEYEKQFWNAMRGKNPAYDSLTQGRHQLTSSYTLPTANSKKFTEVIKKGEYFPYPCHESDSHRQRLYSPDL